MKIAEYISTLKGAKLFNISRVVDMVTISFETVEKSTIYFHIQSMIRVIDDNDSIILSNLDIYHQNPDYKKKWFKKYNVFSKNANIFDVSVSELAKKKDSYIIKSIESVQGDIKIIFENKHKLELFRMVSIYQDKNYSEDYYISINNKNKRAYSYPDNGKKYIETENDRN